VIRNRWFLTPRRDIRSAKRFGPISQLAAEPRHSPPSFHYGQRAVGRPATRAIKIDEHRAKACELLPLAERTSDPEQRLDKLQFDLM
jgi:hypothetical protein